MGIRLIGDSGNAAKRVRQPKTITFGGIGDVAPVQFRAVVGEHPTNPADNGQQPDDAGEVDSSTINPGDHSGSSDSGDTPRRRGRKRGSKNRGSGDSSASTSKTTDSLAGLVCMLHGVVSNMVKVPALKISMSESKELTAAAIEVSQLYDVPLPTEKVAAWMNLGAVAYKVYFVRDVASTKRGPQAVPQQEREDLGVVLNF